MTTTESAEPFVSRRDPELREPAAVDRTSLEVLGFILGAVTALVIVIAVIVVRSHIKTTAAVSAVAHASMPGHQAPPVIPVALSLQR